MGKSLFRSRIPPPVRRVEHPSQVELPPWPPGFVPPIQPVNLRRRTKEPPPRRPAIPAMLRLPLFHALLSFICLALLPPRPLSIPVALGLAFAIVLYIQILAYRAGYRLDA